MDRIRKSLEAPYSRPYEVISRIDKYFVVKLPQGERSVSIDRLKPAKVTISVPTGDTTRSETLDQLLPSAAEEVIVPEEVDTYSSVEVESEVTDPRPNPVTTRSGRTVRFNERPEYSYF